MGMYDDIKTPDIECPVCGELVGEFQSKDGVCMLSTLNYWEVSNFYTHCPNCETWVEFFRRCSPPEIPLSDYEMMFRIYTKKNPRGLSVSPSP